MESPRSQGFIANASRSCSDHIWRESSERNLLAAGQSRRARRRAEVEPIIATGTDVENRLGGFETQNVWENWGTYCRILIFSSRHTSE